MKDVACKLLFIEFIEFTQIQTANLPVLCRNQLLVVRNQEHNNGL